MKLSVAKNLTPLREAAKARIDRDAVRARETFASPGMESVYAEKVREAESFVDFVAAHGHEPDLAPSSFMTAEIGLTRSTARELAELWLDMAEQSKIMLQGIEKLRLTAKAQVDNAATPAAINAIAQGVPWPWKVNQD